MKTTAYLLNSAYSRETKRKRRKFIREWAQSHREVVVRDFRKAEWNCFWAMVEVGLYSPKTNYIDTSVGAWLREARGY